MGSIVFLFLRKVLDIPLTAANSDSRFFAIIEVGCQAESLGIDGMAAIAIEGKIERPKGGLESLVHGTHVADDCDDAVFTMGPQNFSSLRDESETSSSKARRIERRTGHSASP